MGAQPVRGRGRGRTELSANYYRIHSECFSGILNLEVCKTAVEAFESEHSRMPALAYN